MVASSPRARPRELSTHVWLIKTYSCTPVMAPARTISKKVSFTQTSLIHPIKARRWKRSSRTCSCLVVSRLRIRCLWAVIWTIRCRTKSFLKCLPTKPAVCLAAVWTRCRRSSTQSRRHCWIAWKFRAQRQFKKVRSSPRRARGTSFTLLAVKFINSDEQHAIYSKLIHTQSNFLNKIIYC